MLTLISNILDLSKIESGKEELAKVTFSLPDFVNSLRDIHKLNAKNKDLVLLLNTTENLPELIVADQTKLMQILSNLLSNAIKFTPSLDDKGSQGSSELAVACGHDTLVFRVTDSGNKIDKEQQKNIFEPFKQVAFHHDDEVRGSGLGLAISRKLAELMGGSLTVESGINIGTSQGNCFTLKVPLEAVVVEPEPAVDDHNLPDLFAADSRVLVVDDNDINMMLIVQLLEMFGITALEAMSGREAIERVEKCCVEHNVPELILMDMRMPGMDGIEASKSILAAQASADIPIVMVSADVVIEQITRAKHNGILDYLSKPLEFEQLHKVLARYLRTAK